MQDAQRDERVMTLLETTLQQPPELRENHLRMACDGDQKLFYEVTEYMIWHKQMGTFLLEPLITLSGYDVPFDPEEVISERFRIIREIGEGGMGIVYEAFDSKRNQRIAIKAAKVGFRRLLTPELTGALKVRHPNVCLVNEIHTAQTVGGEIDFLTMELLEGETLDARLSRDGRIEQKEALEIVRQLCAGLAEAHRSGVIHRDLKSSNIFLSQTMEGKLRVVITDFGLARETSHESAELAGTPQYMAPELWSGKHASKASDIYALGVLMYQIVTGRQPFEDSPEMFTGKAPFQPETSEEFLRLRQENRIKNPSILVPDIQPAVERAILRCLDPDPKMRPASAAALAASLPGGDPLVAALAAGETPSPEMVAAAGSTEALRPAVAIFLLAGIAVGLFALCLLTPKVQLASQLRWEYSPQVLAEKAREIVRDLGYVRRPSDSASGFENDTDYVRYLETKISGAEQWKRVLSVPPSPVSFWYRQSPVTLASMNVWNRARVTPDEPYPNGPDMVSVRLDMDGRLMRFAAIPPPDESANLSGRPIRKPDWSALFEVAHLDIAQFAPANPESAPPAAADYRAAWTGIYPGRPDLTVRVETASAHGRVFFFEIIWPWTTSNRRSGDPLANTSWLVDVVQFAAFVAAALIARHSWKTGRGDRRGAWRIGVFFSLTLLIIVILQAGFIQAWRIDVVLVLFYGVSSSVLYLALEPWVRRQWPQVMVTWSRVLEGRWRDPRVARDILIGLLFGLAVHMPGLLRAFIDIRLGGVPMGGTPTLLGTYFSIENLASPRLMLGNLADSVPRGVYVALMYFMVLFLLRVLFRRRWLATGVWLVLVTLVTSPPGSSLWIVNAVFGAVASAGFVLMMECFGLFVDVVALSVVFLTTRSLLTTDFTAWYGRSSLMAVIVISVLALWAFQISLRSPRALSVNGVKKRALRRNC